MIRWLGFGGCFVFAAFHQEPPALLGPTRAPDQQKSLRASLDTSVSDSRRVLVTCCRNNHPIHSQQSLFAESDLAPSVMHLYFLNFLYFPPVSAAGIDPRGKLEATTQEVTVNAKNSKS